MIQNLLKWGSKTTLCHTDNFHCTQSFSTATSLRSLLCFWFGRVLGVVFFGWDFILGGGRIQRPPNTLEVMILFKAHITPTERCCTGLLTLPFSLTFHHRILGLNMTTDNVLLASIEWSKCVVQIWDSAQFQYWKQYCITVRDAFGLSNDVISPWNTCVN